MADNALDKIKETEAEAKKIIESAGQEAENMLLLVDKNGEKSLADAENQAAPELEKIIAKAKDDIQGLKTTSERHLAGDLKKIGGIDKKRIEQAAELVVKKILK